MRYTAALVSMACIHAGALGIVETFETAPVGPGDGDVFIFPTFPMQSYTFGDYRFFSDTSIWGCTRGTDPFWASSGYPGAVTSGDVVLYGFGQDLRVERTDNARFTLQQFHAGGVYQDGLKIRVRGIRAGLEVWDTVIELDFNDNTLYVLGFEDIDVALFNIDTLGTPVPGAGGTDAIFAIDDMKLEPFVACVADVTTTGAGPGDPGFGVPDGAATAADLNYFVNAWVASDASIADVTTTGAGPGDPGFGVPDGSVTAGDLNYYINFWVAGCP